MPQNRSLNFLAPTQPRVPIMIPFCPSPTTGPAPLQAPLLRLSMKDATYIQTMLKAFTGERVNTAYTLPTQYRISAPSSLIYPHHSQPTFPTTARCDSATYTQLHEKNINHIASRHFYLPQPLPHPCLPLGTHALCPVPYSCLSISTSYIPPCCRGWKLGLFITHLWIRAG